MKFLFLANGLGEIAQGAAVAQHAREEKIDCRFVNTVPTCHRYITELNFDSFLLSNLSPSKIRESVDRRIEEYSPDVIFCCNSKTTQGMFHPDKELDSLIVSLDSNWLFQGMPAYFDMFFVCFPPEIFKKNRNYNLSDPRIKPVGFIPSGYDIHESEILSAKKELGISNEKMIFSYFGRGVTFRSFLVDKVLDAIELLNRDGKRAKLFLLSDLKIEKDNVISIRWLKNDREYNRCLAASDCVVCHHGMPTISKAILAKVPIISFVPGVLKGVKPSETCEVEPFEELGLCITLTYSSEPNLLKRMLEDVVFGSKGEEMRREQGKHGIKGEKVVLSEISSLLKKRERK